MVKLHAIGQLYMDILQKRRSIDWDDLRVFLALARAHSLALAGRALGVDPTTISRRMARLAKHVGAPLFETVGGRRQLTERGLALYAHAEAIEGEAMAALGGDAPGTGLYGQVRLSVPEGLASWIIAPHMASFAARHPHVHIDLITNPGLLNPSRREADISVMLARPRSARLTAQRLGDYGLSLYAARDYLDAHGTPTTTDALHGYRLVGYVPDHLYAPELDYLDEIAPGLEASIRSTSINVQHSFVAGGAGIGVLPDFIAMHDPRLVRLLGPDTRILRSFWMVMHNDLRQLERIQAVADWLRATVAAASRG